jgi:hypothetical protein
VVLQVPDCNLRNLAFGTPQSRGHNDHAGLHKPGAEARQTGWRLGCGTIRAYGYLPWLRGCNF